MSTNKVIFPKLSEKTTCITGIKLPVHSPEMQDYYTKSQTNKLIDGAKTYTDEEINELAQEVNNKINGIKIPTKVSELVNDKGYLTIGDIGNVEVDLSDYYTKQDTDKLLEEKLSTSVLNNAIDQALLQAKESGEFKGEKGDRGEKGEQGERGEQGPQGLQGIQGEKGANGAKGDKGDKGDKGEQGPQGEKGEKGEDGQNGKDGADGKTPIKGVDDYTDADKRELIEEIDVNVEIPIVNQTSNAVEIQPNVLNVWREVAELTITLATPTDTSIVNEYMVQFTSGTTATTLVLPDTITWMSEPTINTNSIYQISIINNLAIIGEFEL
jgi:hypothetical protein